MSIDVRIQRIATFEMRTIFCERCRQFKSSNQQKITSIKSDRNQLNVIDHKLNKI